MKTFWLIFDHRLGRAAYSKEGNDLTPVSTYFVCYTTWDLPCISSLIRHYMKATKQNPSIPTRKSKMKWTSKLSKLYKHLSWRAKSQKFLASKGKSHKKRKILSL